MAARCGGDHVTRRMDTPAIKEWVGGDQEGVDPLAREGCEDCIYLPGGAGIKDSNLQSESASSRFDILGNGLGSRSVGRIDEYDNANCSGQQFTQQSQLFFYQFGIEKTDACDVAARPGEAGNQVPLDRVLGDAKQDWNCRGRSFGRECREGTARCRDHAHSAAHQISRQLGKPIEPAFGPAELDPHVLAFDVALFIQTSTICAQMGRSRSRRLKAEKSDHRHSRLLLPARRERPRRRRAAEKRDELAPPHHSITSSARASSVAGISRPSALAVGRLMTNSNLVDWTTGSSAGLAPLRMRPA